MRLTAAAVPSVLTAASSGPPSAGASGSAGESDVNYAPYGLFSNVF